MDRKAEEPPDTGRIGGLRQRREAPPGPARTRRTCVEIPLVTVRAMSTPGAAVTRWEYLTAPLLIHNTKVILDNFGRDGWELVAVTSGMSPEQLVGWFKRPVQGGPGR